MVRHTVDVLGKAAVFTEPLLNDPELIWITTGELYAYSREFYDRERGL